MIRNVSRLKILLVASALAVAACGDTNQTTDQPEQDGDLYDQLVGSAVPVDNAIVVDVSNLPVEDPNDIRTAVGVTAPVDALIELSSLDAGDLSDKPLATRYGAIRGEGDGFVWTAMVRADGATGLRLHLTDVYLPRHARLYVYNDDGAVVGPYIGRGPRRAADFWTHALAGDRVYLQVHYDGSDTDRVLDAMRFNVFDVGYLDQRWPLARYNNSELERAFCSFNASCVENADCASIPGAVQPATGAVATMLFASGAFQYICSGGLIADTDSGSDRALFLTANHCISKGREASSLQTWFNYTTSCASPNCDRAWDLYTPDTTGSQILAANRTSDYTLLELNAIPSGANYLPFNATPIANTNGASLYRVSHPAGAPQAFSEHSVDTGAGTCSSWPRGAWIYSRDTYGATEGGSSGSPVLNAAGEVVGQLSGACGTNVSDNCDADNNATVDGALAAYYSEVEAILDPAGGGGGGCTDADADGYCVEDGDCDDSDPSINPGATDICDDGIDQDCKGGDCTTGSCDGLPVGDGCSSDAECCSNKCRGRPGAKSCK